MYDLKKIKARAIELYKDGVFPPDNLKQAMLELGVPEEKMWGVREDLSKLETSAPPTEQKKRRRKKVASTSKPPEIDWRGNITVRGHSINLATLNARDRRLAAAGKD